MENEKYELISKLKINGGKSNKIEIYYDILNKEIKFVGKCTFKLFDKTYLWNVFSEKKYSFNDLNKNNKELNFEEICKNVYEEMEENKKAYILILSYLKNVDVIEIDEKIKQ